MLRLNKVWQYAAAAAAGLALFLAALFYREKAGREKDKRKAEEGARKTERKATDAMTKGLKNEDQAVKDAVSRRRDRKRAK
jgi:hypothetical protein